MEPGRLDRFIDRLITAVSPVAGLKRQYYRERLAGEVYAAAKDTRLHRSNIATYSDPNNIIGLSSPIIRAKVRQLIRDFPYLSRAANIMVDYTVGSQITYQNTTHDAAGKHDKKTITKIEDAVRWWMDEADAAGKLHYYEMMRLAKRQDLEAGEFLILKTLVDDPSRHTPYALQMYEADWLTTVNDTNGYSGATPDGVTETKQGIQYDLATGRIIGYWFGDPAGGKNPQYIPASDVVHGFQTLRPQQLRGVSPFAPGVLLASDLADYMDSEIDGAKMAAKWLAFVKTTAPEQWQAGLPTAPVGSDPNAKLEELSNGIIEYLQPGEDVELASSNRPGQTFEPFVRLLLTMLSVTTGAPYELLSGDYRGMNFSTARVIRNDFAQQLRPAAKRHIRQFGQPTINAAIDYAVMSGRLTLPGYWQNRRRYLDCEWQPPGMDAVDPLRESKSQIESISYGLKSPQEVARERGRDLEDIYEEIKAAQELAADMGLSFDKPSTAVKSNPAAILGE